jgi:hypothetical protein
MLRYAAAAVLAAAVASVPAQASAQEPIVVAGVDVGVSVSAFAQPATLDIRQLGIQRFVAPPRDGRSALLSSLLVSTVVMQALDVHSTYSALGRGAAEANPVMAGLAGNKAAFVATKAAVATATVLAARHVGKRNKVAAIATLVAINSAYAFVVDHNYRVARSLR